MNNYKNKMFSGMLATGLAIGGMVASFNTGAATLDVDLDIELPEMLILYGFSDIDLTLSDDLLVPLLNTTCTTDDCAIDEGATTGNITALAAGATETLDLDIATTVGALAPAANPTVRLDDSWGVRGLGFSSYSASVAATGGGAPNESADITIEDISGATVSLVLVEGYVDVEIDLSNPDSDGDGFIEVDYTITVTAAP